MQKWRGRITTSKTYSTAPSYRPSNLFLYFVIHLFNWLEELALAFLGSRQSTVDSDDIKQKDKKKK